MQFELTGQRQHRGHFLDGVDVAAFQKARHHANVDVGICRLAIGGVDHAVQALGQAFDVGVDQFDAVDLGHHARVFTHGANADSAVSTHFNFLLRRNGNRAAVADHRHTVAGTQHAQGVDVQAAGAHVGFAAIRGLHGDETLAGHGHVQLAAGLDHRAFTEVGGRAFGHGEGARRKAVAKHRHRARLLQVALKAVGGNVRQVVGMGLLRQRVLAGAGHGHVKHLVHSYPPLQWRSFAARRRYGGSKASSEPTS
ncbi:hypothetical protein D3C81_780940 [compost metagenome]